jgi:hypothetical protein
LSIYLLLGQQAKALRFPQIIASPEVNQVLPEKPVLADLTKNLYDCHYDKFFVALGKQASFPTESQ